MNRQCPATKRNGDRCSGSVPEGKYHCWFHDPANSDKRRRAASRGGKGNRSKLSKDLHTLLEDLAERVVSGDLEPYPASVAGSLVGVRLRLLEYERRVREQDEILTRIEALEQATTSRKGGGRVRSLGRRLEALEHSAEEAFRKQAPSLQVAGVDGLKRATPEEVSELVDLLTGVAEGSGWPTPEESPRLWELREAVLYRASPGWAEETRIVRDLLTRGLQRLCEAWEESGRQYSTWETDREYWKVSQAACNRVHALRRGAEPIADVKQAESAIAAIRAPGVSQQEVLRPVGWQ